MSQRTEVAALLQGSDEVVVVRVAQRQGLGSVPSGELVVRSARASAGQLLGGATESAVDALATEVLTVGGMRSRVVPLAEDTAVAAGLACGGSVTLTAHALPAGAATALGTALAAGEPVALAAGPGGVLVLSGARLERVAGSVGDDEAVAQRCAQLLRHGVSVTESAPELLLDLWVPVPTVLVVGEGVLGAAVAAQAAVLGWTVRTVTGVADTEAAVAGLTAADVLVLLDHSPDFDGALLRCARGPAFAGALGSRHTQAARRERLTAAGATSDELAAVHGPVGLDLGARTPAETAVSIVAEVLTVRAGRAPAALGATPGRISP